MFGLEVKAITYREITKYGITVQPTPPYKLKPVNRVALLATLLASDQTKTGFAKLAQLWERHCVAAEYEHGGAGPEPNTMLGF
jgi:hypothetical protein